MNTNVAGQNGPLDGPESQSEQVYKAYAESDEHWEDCLAVVRTSPLRSATFNATELLAKSSLKYGQIIVDHNTPHTIEAAGIIIREIVISAVETFEEWDNDPVAAGCCPSTVFDAYRDSDGIWEAYDAIEKFSPIYRLMRPVLNFLCITHGTTRIGDWVTRLLSDRYLVYIDGLIKDIIEHALDAYANSLTESDTSEHWTVR